MVTEDDAENAEAEAEIENEDVAEFNGEVVQEINRGHM